MANPAALKQFPLPLKKCTLLLAKQGDRLLDVHEREAAGSAHDAGAAPQLQEGIWAVHALGGLGQRIEDGTRVRKRLNIRGTQSQHCKCNFKEKLSR
jgi:hypothetical protein